ncbi:fused MFS/spermidine synthase [Dechloromonas denitrificans]|uniref:fused MFS/spermidine synthase n=1 Tax=Dechloromonas denitrificans TaxID=281362 RepID=UPI001CFB9A85|nr:fused MFS/spermidine synthase [Dechloromonas denitrificans]UCV07222.1 fused MFS/spermidine synthase [Dechloromonas denitrificans]
MKKSATTPRHSVNISEEAGVRNLHFGSDWIQGAMRIARPWSLELAYTREMMAGLLLRPAGQWPRHALLIGLGAGSLAKFIYRNLPNCRITVVEINPQVEFIARQYFKLPDDPRRIDVVIGCGADYMLSGERQFDYILADGFDPEARAGALDTLPFYQACRARLSERGLFCANLLGRNKSFQASAERIRTAFDGRLTVFPSCDSGNTIVFATGGEPVDVSLDELRERAVKLKQDSGLDLLPTISRLQLGASFPDSRLSI